MTRYQLKTGYFFLEGLNSFATTFYFYYLFFYLKHEFQFGNAANLRVAALNGLVYMGGAALAGRFAQKAGPYVALRIGFITMAVMLALGAYQNSVLGHMAILVSWSIGMCFTWPTLEAITSQGETRKGLQHMVGVYNLVWAATSAIAYFSGGALLNAFGMRSLFWIPVGIHVVQWLTVEWLARQRPIASPPTAAEEGTPLGQPAHLPSGLPATVFLKMAWVANPFAYVAINTVVAVIPDIAARMNLSIAQAGVFCSIWFFARFVSFWVFWLWAGWHYRFLWLAGSFAALIASFLIILLSPNAWLAILAQIIFGFATGLCYYSSLFYSMDVGEAQSSHGGLHEAAIGAGVFGGPAMGAAALYLWPSSPNAGAWAVAALLLVGGGTIGAIRTQAKRALK